jgi:hypothetical protein
MIEKVLFALDYEKIERRCPYLKRCDREKAECYCRNDFEKCYYYQQRLKK